MRFANLRIPQGATITSATIEFQVDEADSGPTSITFAGEAIDDAPTFTTADGNITGRGTTTATVPWSNIPAWSTLGEKKLSPDLATILQEIVDRPGWAAGNAAVIIVTGTGSRVAEAYDGEPTGAPLLRVTFTP